MLYTHKNLAVTIAQQGIAVLNKVYFLFIQEPSSRLFPGVSSKIKLNSVGIRKKESQVQNTYLWNLNELSGEMAGHITV